MYTQQKGDRNELALILICTYTLRHMHIVISSIPVLFLSDTQMFVTVAQRIHDSRRIFEATLLTNQISESNRATL